jgi:hypothetical protein
MSLYLEQEQECFVQSSLDEIKEEWGGTTTNGYEQIPFSFLRAYPSLGISHGEFAFIIIMHRFAHEGVISPKELMLWISQSLASKITLNN